MKKANKEKVIVEKSAAATCQVHPGWSGILWTTGMDVALSMDFF